MRIVWGIGKKWFEGDARRRMWLFDAMVWTVLCYGVEIWIGESRTEWRSYRINMGGGYWVWRVGHRVI